MGNITSKSELKFQLKRLLKEQGTAVKTKTLEDFLKTIETWSPWFVTSGALNISEWEQVRGDLQKTLRKEGPEVLPMATFSLWRLIRDALLTEKVRVKQALEATKEVLSEIQDSETKASLCSDIASDAEAEPLSQPAKGKPGKVEERKVKRKRKPPDKGEGSDSRDAVSSESLGARPKQNSSAQTRLYPSLSDFEESLGESTGSEEEVLEGEIAVLQRELRRARLKEKTKGTSGEQDKPPPYPLSDQFRTSPAPPTWLGSEDALLGGGSLRRR